MQVHHDAKMRTTIDIPEHLHQVLTSLATHNRSSLSRVAAELIQRGLVMPANASRGPVLSVDRKTGLPLLQTSRPITPEDVKALEDDA
jgi:hypothetical protein